MIAPNRVSHHLLQAQAIHNEVRAQRDELAERLKDALAAFPEDRCVLPTQVAWLLRARRSLQRVDAFTKTEGDTQL